ncbi:4Fe-4S dicluster domain-containing protein [Chloroflexota bacterium]
MQMGFFFDQSKCSGCYTCVAACQSWHASSSEAINWRKVFTFEKGRFPDVKVSFLSLSCCHCQNPACLEVCPAGAITKREQDGLVITDREKCFGKDACDACFQACPYDIPQFGNEENAKMQKCDFCLERLNNGKIPICVMSCPLEALDFGPIEELEIKYKDAIRDATGFVSSQNVSPSILFKPKFT